MSENEKAGAKAGAVADAKSDAKRQAALQGALTQIERQFGKGTVMRMGDPGARVAVDAIPTGALSLDIALGIGGVPRGRIIEIFGPESSGKTTLVYHILAEAQKLGGVCAFVDAEHAMDPLYAQQIGVDIDELLVSQPDYGEQALEIVDMLIRSGAVDVIAVDSVAALTPRAELEGQMGDQTVGVQARMMSQAMRKLAGNLNRTQTLCVFTNQIREKVGVMFGSPGDAAGRPRAEVLRLAAAGHPPDRDAQGRHRGGRQPRPREGRQEQGRGAVQAGRVRHRVRQGDLDLRLPDRLRDRAQHHHQVGLVLLLRRGAARAGTRQREGVPRRASGDRQGDRDEDLRRARDRPRPRQADRAARGAPAASSAIGRAAAVEPVGDRGRTGRVRGRMAGSDATRRSARRPTSRLQQRAGARPTRT